MPSPLTGDIPITGGQGVIASGGWFSKGVDGEVFTLSGQQGIATECLKVGSASTNATSFTRTPAQWATDFNNLGLGGVPLTGSGSSAQAPIPIPGTEYFYQTGKAGGFPDEWSIGVRYKINSPVSVDVDGGFAYKTTGTIAGLLGTVWTFGANVVDGELFAVCWLYNGIFDPQPGAYVIRLPLGYGTSIVDGGVNAWNMRRTYVGNRFGDSLGIPVYFEAGIYFNSVAVLKHPANATTVMLLTYRALASLPGAGSGLTTAGSEYVLLDYNAQTSGVLTSAQAELGQPWADDGLGFAGVPTANNQFNGYSAPTVGDGSGPTARELMFSRPYQDQPDTCQTRGWHWNETTGLFTPAWTQQWNVVTGDAFDRAAVAYRYTPGASLVGGEKYTTGLWRLGSFSNGGGAGRRYVGKLGPVREAA